MATPILRPSRPRTTLRSALLWSVMLKEDQFPHGSANRSKSRSSSTDYTALTWGAKGWYGARGDGCRSWECTLQCLQSEAQHSTQRQGNLDRASWRGKSPCWVGKPEELLVTVAHDTPARYVLQQILEHEDPYTFLV